MDNNNNNKKGDHSMMWMMVICCALPLAFLFFGGTALSVFSGGYLWPVLIGTLALACIGMTFFGHGSHSESHGNHDEDKATPAGNAKSSANEKNDHSCCH